MLERTRRARASDGEARAPARRTGAAAEPEAAAPVEARLGRGASVSLHVCAVVLSAAALFFAKDFFLPIVLALLAALTLSPIVRALDRRGIPPWASGPVIVLALAAALALGAMQLRAPVADWIARGPEIGRELERELRDLRASFRAVEEATKRVDQIAEGAADPAVTEVVVREPGFLSTASTTLYAAIVTAAVAALLTLFLLAALDTIHERIVRALPNFSDKRKAVVIVRDIERSISGYLLTIALINAGLGVCVGLAMWALGMPTPALWGVMATVLNFMPFLGALIGVVVTAAVALVSFDGFFLALAPPLVYLALTALEGNVVTPLVLGRRLEANPVAILVGVAFWAWLWGPVGVLIAVPILVVVKTIADHVPSWRMLSALLGGSTERAEPDERAAGPDPRPAPAEATDAARGP